MRSRVMRMAVAVVVFLVGGACLWDYDTLREESLGQAEIAAIVGGDLHKHSDAFYDAKITYTQDVLAKHPKNAADRYDDLAVAQAKRGLFKDALATLAAKDAEFPDAYTTHANRGTFLAMQGDLAGATKELDRAIAINPDAHFGREPYQLKLLAYLARVVADPTLASRENFLGIDAGSWAGESKVITNLGRPAKRRGKPDPAILAIAGLVRFGDAEGSPHVWWALGCAFVAQGDSQLAIRAFRRAELLGHPRARADGAVVAQAIKTNDLVCCRDPAKDPSAEALWGKVSKALDAEWAIGHAADARRQTSEDAKLARHRFVDVFGY